jgi:hypothetical protein
VKQADGTCKLTQKGLVDRLLKTAGLVDCNRCTTPGATTPVGSDSEGAAFEEDWEYACVVGMLMYLFANTRSYISYAVHQPARHTHVPRASNDVAVNSIMWYLKEAKTQGVMFKPDKSDQVECYGDADFNGLHSVEDGQETISVKSHTVDVVLFSGVPILLVSKMQTQIALSNMEAEYIALSKSMRNLIMVREILKEIKSCVFLENE